MISGPLPTRCSGAVETMARLVLTLLLVAMLAVPAPLRADPASFGNWAAAVVAGDWRAADGQATDAFENARRDMAAALVTAGFRPENIRQFSPDPYTPGVLETNADRLNAAMRDVASKTRGGCLFYVTTHGSPDGFLILGHKNILKPADLDLMLDLTCSLRPTVIILSACFSGMFIPELEAGNRLILTAASKDRSSFGCGVNERYPYFDDCLISVLPKVADLAALAASAGTCVSAREKRERMSPPSNPQVSMGIDMRTLVPTLSLRPE